MIKKFEKDVYLKSPYYTTLIYEQAWTCFDNSSPTSHRISKLVIVRIIKIIFFVLTIKSTVPKFILNLFLVNLSII
jgi:hypothetical protein